MIFAMPRKFSLQRWSTWELRYSIDIYFSKEFCIFVPTHQVMSYAVRGPLAIRAVELEKEIKAVRASFTTKNMRVKSNMPRNCVIMVFEYSDNCPSGCREAVLVGDQGEHRRCARDGKQTNHVHQTGGKYKFSWIGSRKKIIFQ